MKVLEVVALGLGYCCVYRYLLRRADHTTSEIARESGVTPRQIRKRRRDMRDGTLRPCSKCERPFT